jgi:hypothetical protein
MARACLPKLQHRQASCACHHHLNFLYLAAMKPIRCFIVSACLFAWPMLLKAQDSIRYIPLGISFFNNQTSLPIGMKLGMRHAPVHPGIRLSYLHYYSRKKERRSDLFQSYHLAYYYHRYSQHGIQLYSELNYRYPLWKYFQTEAGAGAGYLHAIPDLEQFTFNSSSGEYEKKKFKGRPQAMLSFYAGFSVPLRKRKALSGECVMCRSRASVSSAIPRIFIQYQFWLQMPFVKNYVPILPNTALHLGFVAPLKCKKKEAAQ